MTETQSKTDAHLTTISIPQLRAAFNGQVIAPSDAGYDEARTVFPGGIDRRPAVIIRVADAADVARVVSLARETGLELAIRSGGHSNAGHSVTEGGIVLDLSDLRALQVDVERRSAWAETGLTAGAYTSAAGAYGLATGFGDTGSVGIGGLTLGGWWDQVLLGHRVTIKTRHGDVTGVIGAKPPHLLSPEERDKIVKKDEMYIDIGASCKEDVEKAGVRVGDPIVPKSAFEELSVAGRYLCKAFDDRVGVALVVDALRALREGSHPNTVYGAVTTQEEVGLRGARTSADVVEPDVALILESDIAGDVPGIKPEISSIKLGKGPSVLVLDGSMIPNLALRD